MEALRLGYCDSDCRRLLSAAMESDSESLVRL
jgi:hypothetical protein